ncbi:MAG TPA: MauE/DoxX family redox-associated membrane protein [Pyrinomonadaceae bacterium]
MALVIALVRLMLSLVFGVAGITKLADQKGTRDAVMNFGAPKPFAPSVALVLPLLELAIAVGLLFSATAWLSALVALLVLAFFVVAISINLAQGKAHACHCFGQIYSRPLGWPTLARNIVFALAAGLVIWNGAEFQPPLFPTISGAFGALSSWQLVGFIAVAVIAGGIYLRRRKAMRTDELQEQPTGLAVGSPAPEFDLPAYEGGQTSLSQLLALGKPVLLIFTNPKCFPCIKLFKEIADWQVGHNDQLTITLLTFGTIKDNFVNVARNGLGQVLLQQKNEVLKLYGARVTPAAVIVDTEGRIFSKVAAGADEIRALLKGHVHTGDNPLGNKQTTDQARETGSSDGRHPMTAESNASS